MDFPTVTVCPPKGSQTALNYDLMSSGLQSIPKQDQDAGFEVRMWNNSGRYQTPGFGEKYRGEYYKEDKYQRVLLEYPNDIDKQVGSG